MKILESVVSLSFMLPHPPEDRKKKKMLGVPSHIGVVGLVAYICVGSRAGCMVMSENNKTRWDSSSSCMT